MIAAGAWFMLRVPWVYLQARIGASHSDANPVALQTQKLPIQSGVPAVHHQVVQNQVAHGQVVNQQILFPKPAPAVKAPVQGTLIGRVVIPSLNLTAPIVEGTALDILAHSAGHLTTSVLPGQQGTTVIAAHDVTYFHHIDALKPGDKIEVTTSEGRFVYTVTGHRVVTVGTNAANTYFPSLILETCYPLNALTLVNHRYWVSAVLTSSTLTPPSQGT